VKSFLSILCAGLLGGVLTTRCLGASGVAFDSAEALFRQDPRWLGTDGADSTVLSDGRIYWTFEDSLIANSPAHSRTESVFVRNSIAIQEGRDPLNATMRFYWHTLPGGAPTAFFPNDGETWHWTGGALHLEEGPLVTFLMRTVATPGENLGFANRGYSVAITDNPLDEPSSWRTRIVRGPKPGFDALPASDLVRDGAWVIGLSISQKGRHAAALVRYRALELAAGQLNRPEWWNGHDWVPESSLGPDGPAFVIDDSGNEATIHWDPGLGTWVHVSSRGFGTAVFVMRHAPAITGPWSEPVTVYDPPENRDAGIHVYSALAHPELAAPLPGELLVTYATNAVDLEDLFSPDGSQRLYWPRVIRVRLGTE